MRQYMVFQRNGGDRKVVDVSTYPWMALVLAPPWAFRAGLLVHGAALTALYGLCAVVMVGATHGVVVGGAIALWLGAFTAHNAAEWIAGSHEARGYVKVGAVEADSPRAALHAYREPKRHRMMFDRVSPEQRGEMGSSERPVRTPA